MIQVLECILYVSEITSRLKWNSNRILPYITLIFSYLNTVFNNFADFITKVYIN